MSWSARAGILPAPTGGLGAFSPRSRAVLAQIRALDKVRLNRPALIRAPLWTASTAVAPAAATPVVRRLSSGELVAYTGAGTTGTVEPTITYLGPMTDGTATCYALGRVSAPVPAGVEIPTVTPTAGASTLAQFFNFATNSDRFLETTSPFVVAEGSNNYSYLYNNGGNATGTAPSLTGVIAQKRTIEWATDAPVVDFQYFPAGSGYIERPRFYVDDYPLEEVPSSFAGALGSTQRFVISYGSSVAVRNYRMEIHPGVPLRGIGIGSGYTIGPVLRRGLTAILHSDSFGHTTIPRVAFAPSELLGEQVLRAVGIRYVLNMTEGGTGYVKDATNGRKNALWVAQNNVMASQPVDVVVIWMSYNDADGSVSQAAIRAAALALWQERRRQHPDAVLMIFGPWSSTKTGIASFQQTDATVQAAFREFADPNSEFCSPFSGVRISGIWGSSGPTRPLTTGTGYQGATNGTGNADTFISTDGVHVNPPGQIQHLQYLSAQLENMLVSQGL